MLFISIAYCEIHFGFGGSFDMMSTKSAYSFEQTIASRGYHVYKHTNWSEAKVGDPISARIETNAESKKVDPYSCAISIRRDNTHVTVGHIPRELSRYVFFFISEEGGSISGKVEYLKYQQSPIPQGGFEIPIKMKFACDRYVTHPKMKDFVSTLYTYQPDVDEEENVIREEDPFGDDEHEEGRDADVEDEEELVMVNLEAEEDVAFDFDITCGD